MKKIGIISGISIVLIACLLIWNYSGGNAAPETREHSSDSRTSSDSNHKVYTDAAYYFSLEYPSSLTATSFDNPGGEGEVVTFSDSSGQGVQILITPFDEDLDVLTVDRIKKDQSDLSIINPQDVILGEKGKGVAFFDGEGDTASRQVWFIANKNLYQITAPRALDTLLQGMLNSWVIGK